MLSQVCHGLEPREFEVTVAYTRRSDTPSERRLREIFPDYVHLVNLGQVKKTTATLRIWRYVRQVSRVSPNALIHAHSSVAGLAARLLPRSFTGDNVLYSPHGFAFLKTDVSPLVRGVFEAVEAALALRCAVVLAVSESERLEAARIAKGARTFAIANGVNLRAWSPSSSRNSTNTRPRVGCVGRVTAQKGPDRFSAVAKALSDRADFIWIGADDTADGHKTLGPTVKVLPWSDQAETLRHVRGLDLFLFMSRWEGMPLALIEAQCAGVPAIATRIPGNTDIVIHEETGLLVDTLDQAIEAVERLLDDAPLRAKLADNALDLSSRFDVARMQAAYASLYRRTSSSQSN